MHPNFEIPISITTVPIDTIDKHMDRLILLIAALIIQPFAGLVCVGPVFACRGETANVCCIPAGSSQAASRFQSEPIARLSSSHDAKSECCCSESRTRSHNAALTLPEIPGQCDPRCCLWTDAPPMHPSGGSPARFIPPLIAAPASKQYFVLFSARDCLNHVADASSRGPHAPTQRTRRAMLCVRTI